MLTGLLLHLLLWHLPVSTSAGAVRQLPWQILALTYTDLTLGGEG